MVDSFASLPPLRQKIIRFVIRLRQVRRLVEHAGVGLAQEMPPVGDLPGPLTEPVAEVLGVPIIGAMLVVPLERERVLEAEAVSGMTGLQPNEGASPQVRLFHGAVL